MCSLGVSHLPTLPQLKILGAHLGKISVSYSRIQHCMLSRNVGNATTNLSRSGSQNNKDLIYRPVMK